MRAVDFSRNDTTSQIFRMAGPLMAALLLNLLYSIVDRIYIGRIPCVATAALGGLGLCFPILTAVLAFANLIGMGAAPLCAMARGRGDLKKAALIQNLAFSMLVLLGIVLTLGGELLAEILLKAGGSRAESMDFALPYLRIYFLGTLPVLLASGLAPLTAAAGFPRIGMYAVAAGAVSNILLDPLFIFVFELGIRGAAAASVLAQILSAGLILKFLFRPCAELPGKWVDFGQIFRERSTVLDILSLGSVGFIMTMSGSLTGFLGNFMLSRFGGFAGLAVMTIVTSIRPVLEVPMLAVSEGAAPLLSYNYGAGLGDRVLRVIRMVLIVMLVYTAIAEAVIEWHPEWFIRIFSDTPDLVEQTVPLLRIFLIFFVFQSLQFSAQSTFKALNKKKRAIFFSLFRKVIIMVPLILFLPYWNNFGAEGVFWAEPVSNLLGGSCAFACMLITLVPELRRLKPAQQSSMEASSSFR